MKRFLAFLIACGLATGVGSAAPEIPSKPTSYVNDRAGLLSGAVRGELEALLAQFEKETSNQVVVMILPSLEGAVIEDLSVRMAQGWGIGNKKKDNGILLLIAKEDRAVRIEVGYGLEGALPDVTCKRIIEREIVPAFRQGDYDGGVRKALHAILAATKGEYQAGPADADEWVESHKEIVFALLVFFIVLPIITYLGILFLMTSAMGPVGFAAGLLVVAFLELMRRAFLSGAGQTLTHGGWRSGSGGGFSGGGFSGGGFSGGGGSFGGGGAGGRW